MVENFLVARGHIQHGDGQTNALGKSAFKYGGVYGPVIK